jgi:hypothetical protein
VLIFEELQLERGMVANHGSIRQWTGHKFGADFAHRVPSATEAVLEVWVKRTNVR